MIDMPLNNAPSTTTAQRVKDKIELVEPSACVDFALWGGLVPENFDELEKMDKEGCVAFKAFLSPSSPDFEHLGYGETYEAMQIIKRFGGRIGFHCEDYSTILHLEEMMRRAGTPKASISSLAENSPSTWPGKNSKMQKPSTMIPSA